MPDKQEIKIFVASSSKLKKERKMFEGFVSELNNTYQDYTFKHSAWEYVSNKAGKGRTQDEYNDMIHACDIFIVLFGKTAGTYTIEEFKLAHELYIKNGKPLILCYFKEFKKDKEIDESLVEFKQYISDPDSLEIFYDTFKKNKDLKEKVRKEIQISKEAGTLGNVSLRFRAGKFLNDDFKPSLITFNIIKYCVLNRIYSKLIWIGSTDLFDDILAIEQHIDKERHEYISRNKTDQQTFRVWKKKSPAEFMPSDENIFLVVENQQDYKNLIVHKNSILDRDHLIICFAFPSKSISKIYAHNFYTSMGKSDFQVAIDTATEFQQIASDEELLHGIKLKNAMDIPLNVLDDFLNEQQKFDYNYINSSDYRKTFIEFVLTYGENHQKQDLIHYITQADAIIFNAIKTDIPLLNVFFNRMNVTQFEQLIQTHSNDIDLIHFAIRDTHQNSSKFLEILQKKLPSKTKYSEFLKIDSDRIPVNKREFWVLQKTNKNILETFETHQLNTSIKYLVSITTPIKIRELTAIKAIPDIRVAYAFIAKDSNTASNSEFSTIYKNLYLYEI